MQNLDIRGTLTELGLGRLDRHHAIKARVTSLVDIAHFARTNGRKDFVRIEIFARGKRHLNESAKINPLERS